MVKKPKSKPKKTAPKKSAKTHVMPKRPAKTAKAVKKPARHKETRMPSRPAAKIHRAPTTQSPTSKPAAAATKAAAAAGSPKPAPPTGLAAKLAAFSSKALVEEEEPVAVRSWSEAKADKPASKTYLPKTGKVSAAEDVDEEDDVEDSDEPEPTPALADPSEDDADGDDEPLPAGKPQMNPLAGQMSVPKDRELEFQVAPRHKIKKAGKGGEKPEEFGPVELRQATASGGRHITRSKAENLQKAADRIQPLAMGGESTGKRRAEPEKFEVAADKGTRRALPSLDDWGDVEIGQQTLSGSRKVGSLESDEAPEGDPRKKSKK